MRSKFLLMIFFLPAICGCVVDMVNSEDDVKNVSELKDFSESSAMLKIKFSAETADMIAEHGVAAVSSELPFLDIISADRLFPYAGKLEDRQREAGLDRWYMVTYREDSSSTKAASEVKDVFEDVLVETPRRIRLSASFPFDDVYAPFGWYLSYAGSFLCQESPEKKGVDINVLPVWEYTGGNKDVIINVVDTGIQSLHEDLSGVVLPAGPEGSRNFVDGSYSIVPGDHGTHVAATIAAINNNGIGSCGIAGGLDGKGGVRILNSQIFSEMGKGRTKEISASDENVAAAIVWGANNGALISQNSWTYVYDSEEEARKSGISGDLKDAIDYFIKYAGCDVSGKQIGLMKGGLVVFAAGNDGWSICYPSSYEPVIAVGAVGPSGKRAFYSNYGPWVDICAPGGDTKSESSPSMNDNLCMIFNAGVDGYYFMEGTSMACPQVSGVAALMISLYGGPGFTADMLHEMLVGGADYSYGVAEGIGPLLDAEGAMNYSGQEVVPRIITAYDGTYVIKGHEVLEVDYAVESNKDISISIDCGDGASAEIGSRSCSISFNNGSGNLTGKYRAVIRAVSGSGLSAEKVIEYEILENHVPVAGKVTDRILRQKGSSFFLAFSDIFNDPDGGPLEYTWFVDKGKVLNILEQSDGILVKSVSDGVEVVTLTATDPCGKSCSVSFSVGSYDDSSGPSIYPYPVSDRLSICVGGENDTDVKLFSSTGVLLYEVSELCSILNQIEVDMSGFAAGRYMVSIEYEGNRYMREIAKL